jgi:hypothetical protein
VQPDPPDSPSIPPQPPAARRTLRQWQACAEQLLSQGHSRDTALTNILRDGCPPEQAHTILSAAYAAQHARANKVLGCSAAVALAGLMATVIGFAIAADSGGTFFIWWGAMLVGGIGVLAGLARKLKLR